MGVDLGVKGRNGREEAEGRGWVKGWREREEWVTFGNGGKGKGWEWVVAWE